MIKILLITFTITAFAHAKECHNYDSGLPLVDLEGFGQKLQEKIPWFSATDKNIDEAKCVDSEDFSKEAIEKHLQSFGDERVTRTIAGITLTDHPRMIDLLRKLLRTNEFDPQIKLPASAHTCKTVFCVSSKILGDQTNNILYILDKYGLNLNHHRKKLTAKWNKDEIQHIMKSLNYVPKQILPFETNRTMVRGKRNNPYGSTYANATMFFFDPHFAQTPQMQTYTIFHEIGHNMASEFKLDKQKEWLDISAWEPNYEKDKEGKRIKVSGTDKYKIKDWHAGHKHAMTSEYGQTNPAEDFAEAFASYRFTPEKLKKHSPKKYEYMKKNIFQGAEFLAEETCNKANTLPYKYFALEDAKLPKKMNDLSICQESIINLIHQEGYEKKLTECTKKLMAQESIKKKLKEQNINLNTVHAKSILNSAQLPIEDIKITPKDLEETKRMLTNEIMNAYIGKYKGYASCDDMKKHSYQNLDSLEERVTDFQFFSKQKSSLNESLLKICQKHQTVKGFTCSDYLWKLSDEESLHKKRLCGNKKDLAIRCSDSINKYSSSMEKESFKKLCQSPRLEAPDKMPCDNNTRRIFSELAKIPFKEKELSLSHECSI